MNVAAVRIERDSLGPHEVPESAYWGVHTARALTNFPISGTTVGSHRELVAALGAVKLAAARANHDLGLLDDRQYAAIRQAADEVRAGKLDAQFVVDVIQGGAGTSTNMNANEVIANRALEILGLPRGAYDVIDPLDHVNRCQSTNDVYPTAVRLALLTAIDRLARSTAALADAFAAKAAEFRTVPKIGRTQLQDAVPMTVGQELGAFAVTLREELARLADSGSLLREVNLGATAIGTGITAHPDYRQRALAYLAEITGRPVVGAGDLVEATMDTGAFVQVSSVLKRVVVKASKVCNDLRLLGSGPQAGLAELLLPARQAGSSIMPGKVNPVIPEMVNQVAFWVIGTDLTVTMAAEGGQLQLNAFEPVICHGLLQGFNWTAAAFDSLRELCVDGIRVDEPRLTAAAARNVGLVTALTPQLGYARAAEIAKAVLSGAGDVRALALATGTLDAEALDALLRPETLANLAPLQVPVPVPLPVPVGSEESIDGA
ncbi:aspartate ammonia-lyase [Actinospica sp. MGRD01-02]|uniref:Aspartate ammonia-lyase n=1 Tax=Actinospica acidithermotolerans TaxID=2828514 RepID=A0A941IKT2_9ACTN|nr:aspartate ammonia-lyase [Actinospica acidithermotolerans]MBR7826991.1 aspartate ammonia-lyase [Actinospica acidithermotolerans]